MSVKKWKETTRLDNTRNPLDNRWRWEELITNKNGNDIQSTFVVEKATHSSEKFDPAAYQYAACPELVFRYITNSGNVIKRLAYLRGGTARKWWGETNVMHIRFHLYTFGPIGAFSKFWQRNLTTVTMQPLSPIWIQKGNWGGISYPLPT